MDLFALKTLLFLSAFLGRGAQGSILQDGPIYASLGKNVTLKTVVDKSSFMVIIWSFSAGADPVSVITLAPTGVTTSESYKGRVQLNTTNGFLTLGPLKSEDSGHYSINAITTAGVTQTGEVELRVLEPVSEVTIKSSLPEAIEHNSTVVLTCTAKGSFLKFTWLNGTTPIVADGKRLTLKESQDENYSQMTISSVLRTDLVGPIFCTAANNLETEKSAPFNLTVFYGPEKVAISPDKPTQVVKARSPFKLTCSARSHPPAAFLWYFNEQKTGIAGPDLTLETIEKLGYSKKEGNFTCTATNEKTQRTVRSAPVSLSVLEPITGTKISGPDAVLMAGNSSANLSCHAAAGTVTMRAWLKDGKPLVASSRVVFAADGSSVMINPLQKDDNGQFTCQLTNPVNTDRAVYTMVVNYGPEALQVTGSSEVLLQNAVTLTCAAASVPPANYTWKVNDTLTAIKTAAYTIDKATYSNSGMYTCEAHNAITGKKSSQTHNLKVLEELPNELSDGAIAGIVIAVLVALAAAIALVFYCRQKVPVESPY